jgi:hypothetical protein
LNATYSTTPLSGSEAICEFENGAVDWSAAGKGIGDVKEVEWESEGLAVETLGEDDGGGAAVLEPGLDVGGPLARAVLGGDGRVLGGAGGGEAGDADDPWAVLVGGEEEGGELGGRGGDGGRGVGGVGGVEERGGRRGGGGAARRGGGGAVCAMGGPVLGWIIRGKGKRGTKKKGIKNKNKPA